MEGLSDQLTEIEAKAKFQNINLKDNNLEDIYFNNLQVWLYRNSDKREPVSEEFEPVNFVSKDPNKLICSKTVKGMALTEERFIEKEIKLLSQLDRDNLPEDEVILFDIYLNYLKEKITPIKETPKNLHNNIFKDNAFEVWQSMFEDFKISKSSRTDVKFMFEIMKKDGLIYDTVREVDFLNWVNSTYQMAIEKISYADLKNKKRNAIYNNAKELYKI